MKIRRRTSTARASFLAALLGASALTPAVALAAPAPAEAVQDYQIAAQPLQAALLEFSRQSRSPVVASTALLQGLNAPAVEGRMNEAQALDSLLAGTGLVAALTTDGGWSISRKAVADPQSGGAAGDGADGTVEALIVTAQKREEDIQDVPIAISAFTQEDLTRSQVAGGPDLMTQVPNFTFTKTNFSSYSIQIRGIGTQAISATTDAAVAVAFNNSSMIRNRFFEQEFYDLERVEVLRGPQGTLYGRNATAGVVNIISAKPTFGYEAKLSADVANYNSTRLEGMVNLPLVEDAVALRLAGAWTKRDGYTTNQLTGNPIDGRDLWSARLSLRIEPTETFRANFVYEHFEEDDDRLRSGKQLCHKHIPEPINGVPVPPAGGQVGTPQSVYSQGCIPASLYSPDSYQTPNGFALPYYGPLSNLGAAIRGDRDPYVSSTQSRDLRVIESTRDPEYRARTDLAQLQLQLDLASGLTVASETLYSYDTLFSTQDFNRFNTLPGVFDRTAFGYTRQNVLDENDVFCDPQLGCSDRLVLADLSTAESRQFSQELRVSSDYQGPFNFSLGANFLRYDTEDKYYVFINSLTLFAANPTFTGGRGIFDGTLIPWVPFESDNSNCIKSWRPGDPFQTQGIAGCVYIDPNPIGSLNDEGHNYFLSKNPYKLISYAAFGEAYYNVTPDLKVTAGLRWTVDKKRAPRIPSWLMATFTVGYPVVETVTQEWREPTGRLAVDWKPDVGFTDETMLYASYARGYKAGGANPPPAVIASYGDFPGLQESLIQPKTFDAEYVHAFEVGSKNTLLDGTVTFNANAFYYDYEGYQISQIINRSAVNSNFDAKVWGIEIEADWRPLENLRLGFKGGYENTRMADGSKAIDLMDRTAGDPYWVVAKPFPTVPSNCILPAWFVSWNNQINVPYGAGGQPGPCVIAYMMKFDPATQQPYEPFPQYVADQGNDWVGSGYPGFDPLTAPNGGEGIYKDLSGNELPNAPDFTATITADYTVPLPNDWLATLHTDLYYQSEAWTRIFNTEGYDKLKAYTNVNLAAIFTNEDAGWRVMAYVKNVFDRDSITGAFLNSDDTGLTTNVFLTEPRLYGLRVTKEWNGSPILGGLLDRSLRGSDQPPLFTVELGGLISRHDAAAEVARPEFIALFETLDYPLAVQRRDLDWGDTREVRVSYTPRGPWSLWASARFGKANGSDKGLVEDDSPGGYLFEPGSPYNDPTLYSEHPHNYGTSSSTRSEEYKIADFAVGRDVGLGRATSRLSLGLRYAKLNSKSNVDLRGMPDLHYQPYDMLKYVPEFSKHHAAVSADREFEGLGPLLSWEGAMALLETEKAGRISADWAARAGVLFGRQSTELTQQGESRYFEAKYRDLGGWPEIVPRSFSRPSSKSVSVPTAEVNLGLSYQIGDIKFGGGYRWERYFDAIDGGYRERKTFDRTIDGPYFKLSAGFGG